MVGDVDWWRNHGVRACRTTLLGCAMTRHERAIVCCHLADEEERLDAIITDRTRILLTFQEETSRMIDKRDALIVVRHHLIGELK